MKTPSSPIPVHRIARINYFPRVLGFAATFCVILLLDHERNLGLITIGGAAVSFLLYPQLAWWHARLRRDSKRAEIENLLFDCLLLGAWAGGLGFTLWITFSLLTSSLLNNAVNGGLPRLGLATGPFLLGGLGGYLLFAPGFIPAASLPVTAVVIVTTLLYVLGVGVTHYWQNRQLARAHNDIARKNRVFRALLRMGVLTHESPDVPILIEKALDQFRELYPGEAFGIVLFHPKRRQLVRNAGFTGLDTTGREDVMNALAAHNEGDRREQGGELTTSTGRFRVLPMHRHLTQNTGYLVLTTSDPDEIHSVLPLFIDQLGAALENKLLTQQLRRAAETDGLTGLFNRGYLESRLREAIDNKLAHPNLDFAVIMIDLIGLKRSNDHHGHEAGDTLIQTVAGRLVAQARESDVVARFGGDEFVILCLDCSEENAASAVERLNTACDASPCEVALADGRQVRIPVQLSVGVAGSDRHAAHRVMQTADRRMYENKLAWYENHDQTREG